MIKVIFLLVIVVAGTFARAQVQVDLSGLRGHGGVRAVAEKNLLNITWPTRNNEVGKIIFNLQNEKPLFNSIQLIGFGKVKEIGANLDPAFLLTVGKRDLVSQNGWNIFFDKTNKLPHNTYKVTLNKKLVSVASAGTRTVIKIGEVKAGGFAGVIEITLYNGSPLFNVAAVMATEADSTAILYDAGLLSKGAIWKNIAWTDTQDMPQSVHPLAGDTSKNVAVKHRMIVGESKGGTLAIFPAPHQYFYPLDEAFNLKFTWHGTQYRQMIGEYGMGIRQDLMGDNRWVPWFNSPPKTMQRLNFFCLLSTGPPTVAMGAVKQFTHGDSYKPLPGYKTISSHFHNEYVMKVALPGKAVAGTPGFVNVFKNSGINIIHLGEFHYTAHPKGPDDQRLKELKTLFDVCKKYSDGAFLLLPGEEPNEFFGGHWLQFFPKPVYWIMSRKEEAPFVTDDPAYGKVYRIADKADMLKLLEAENGLAWTAHARTKGSTGYPDKYKDEDFFKSDRFFGAAWKAIPADLSQPRLGKRILDLMDDMANWGFKKHAIAEADLFSIEPENEMYAHLNVNYLQLDKLPAYNDGWQPVLDAMQQGKFFVSTGEVLLPLFTVNGKRSGETVRATADGKAEIELEADWTFPLNFAEIITGDGVNVYREKINLDNTLAFGKNKFSFKTNIKNKKWIRVELWDVAANGAFTQQVWIEGN
ncbi:MAG: hypothetical protein H7X88_03610 [Gloeobacteraceae cyanobacterium ES-bin-316]|nr:hypothetical protein [Ferruginibacter sp.]